MRQIAKKIVALFLACAMITAIMPIQNASAATELPNSIYLKQEGAKTCTLASTTMMLRSRMYLSGNSAWSSVTESDVRKVAWHSTQGLYWNFTYSINGNSMSVSHGSVSGISISSLKALLDAHPEGIVLYCKSKPHAVFLTDYEGDTFYCADPANDTYSGRRLKLEDSSLGAYYGSQAKILKKVSAYWYISSYQIAGDQYTVNYDSNGGSGAMNSQKIVFGQTFTLAENAYVREGYKFIGWNVERSDQTWLVGGQGWLTEAEIASGGYSKTIYPDGWSGRIDNSWTGGAGGLTYTFYAQWEQTLCADGHSFGDWETIVAATCTEEGEMRRDCTDCPTYETRAIAPGHSWSAATCTEAKFCAACGETEGDALGHSYTVDCVTEPTCTTQGWTTYACTGCGERYMDHFADRQRHEFEAEVCIGCGVDYYFLGDINGDGKINNKDATRLFQYLSDWDVEVVEAALDVNGDGAVNNKDATRLFQYLSDWDVEIF